MATASAPGASAPSARAQLPGFQIGASGGIAFPVSDLGNSTNTGYNIAVAVGVKPYASPIGLRFEAAYNEFGLQGGGGNVNIPAFTANATLALPAAGFTPYVIGGAGLYRPSANLTGIGSGNAENDFGFNIGGGFHHGFPGHGEGFCAITMHSHHSSTSATVLASGTIG